MTPKPDAPRSVPAWDLPTRLFHWTLVALILSSWVSYEFAEELGDVTLVWHRWSGLAVLVLLIWRLLWGFGGSSTARFSTFVRGPLAAWQYAQGLFGSNPAIYLGHNPLGAAMVLTLLLTIGIIAMLGLFAVDDNDLSGGPLYRLVDEAANNWATRWHGRIFDLVMLPLVALHVAANILYGLVKKEPLIRAMVTGAKPALAYEDAPKAEIVARPLVRALAALICAAVLVLGGILAVGGRLW